MNAATTTLSSKGQVVIPEEIRERLGLKAGAQFVVVADRDVVIFKVLDPPALGEFAPLVARARQAAMNAMIVDAPPLAGPVSADPDDDMFLAAALAAQTEVIVSGEQDLLQVSGWRGIEVLTPRQFVEQYLVADS